MGRALNVLKNAQRNMNLDFFENWVVKIQVNFRFMPIYLGGDRDNKALFQARTSCYKSLQDDTSLKNIGSSFTL
jgi:hypothetical protein